MPFVSSVLSNDRVSTLSSDNTISSIKEMTIGNNDSYLYSVLEFNESMHKLEIEDKIAYYRALVESINGDPSKLEQIHESYIVSGIKRIVEFIERIIEWMDESDTVFMTVSWILLPNVLSKATLTRHIAIHIAGWMIQLFVSWLTTVIARHRVFFGQSLILPICPSLQKVSWKV